MITYVTASQRGRLQNQIELSGRPCQTRVPGEVDELTYSIPETIYSRANEAVTPKAWTPTMGRPKTIKDPASNLDDVRAPRLLFFKPLQRPHFDWLAQLQRHPLIRQIAKKGYLIPIKMPEGYTYKSSGTNSQVCR